MTTLHIQYCGREIHAYTGQRLLDAILEAGEDHRHICGGHGFCTSCRVEVLDDRGGLTPISQVERDRLGADAGHLRLACQVFVTGRVNLRVPSPGPNRFPPDE